MMKMGITIGTRMLRLSLLVTGVVLLLPLPARSEEAIDAKDYEAAQQLAKAGKLEEAEKAFRDLAAARERQLGAEHQDTLQSRMGLFGVQFFRGKYAEAETELAAVLAIQERVLGAEHPATLESRGNLASTQSAQGKHAEAEKELRALLPIQERVLGAEHPDTLISRSNFTLSLEAQGKYGEAEKELHSLLAICERLLGAEHPDTLKVRSNLASALGGQGKHGEAEKELRVLLGVRERLLGAEHSLTVYSRSELAINLNTQGKYAEAEKESRALLTICERLLGAEHPDTLKNRGHLPRLLNAQGKYVEAEKESRALLAIQARVLGAEHPTTLKTSDNLAVALIGQGKCGEGEKELRALLPILERVLGVEHPDSLICRSNLATALDGQGKHAEAEKESRALLPIQERVQGAEHPDTLRSRSNLAAELGGQGKYAEAEKESRAILGIQERLLGVEHPDVLATRKNLAAALNGQGKQTEAEKENRAVQPELPRPSQAQEVVWLEDEPIKKAWSAVVAVEGADGGYTTGFMASTDGLVVTSAINLEGDHQSVTVVTSEGKSLHGCKLLAINGDYDLAILYTGQKDVPFLELETKPPEAREPCAILYRGDDGIKATDGIFMAQKNAELREGRRVDGLWSVAFNPRLDLPAGGPILNAAGRVVAMADASTLANPKTLFGVPHPVISALLAQAKSAKQALPFPKRGSVTGTALPAGRNFSEATRLADAGDIEGAVEKLQAALVENPEHPLVLNHLGKHFLMLGDFAKAREIAERRLRLKPDGFDEICGMAGLDLVQGRLQKNEVMMNRGLEMLRKVQTASPRDGQFALGLGSAVLLSNGPNKEALAMLKLATELDPDNRLAWEEYAGALSAAGDFAEAKRARDKASDIERLQFELKYSAPRRNGQTR